MTRHATTGPYLIRPGTELNTLVWRETWGSDEINRLPEGTGTAPLGGGALRSNSFVLLDDGRVLCCRCSTASTTAHLVLGYAPSLRELLEHDGSVIYDRTLMFSEWSGSGNIRQALVGGVSRLPNGNLNLCLRTNRNDELVAVHETFPMPSGGGGPDGNVGVFFYQSADEGVTWFQTQALPNATNDTTATQFNYADVGLVQQASNGVLLVCAGDHRPDGQAIRRSLFASTDNANTWFQTNIPLASGANTSAIGVNQAVSEPTPGFLLTARVSGAGGSGTHHFWTSSDGVTWTENEHGLEEGNTGAMVALDSSEFGAARHGAVTSGGLFTRAGQDLSPPWEPFFFPWGHPDSLGGSHVPSIWPVGDHLLFSHRHYVLGVPIGARDFACGPLSW